MGIESLATMSDKDLEAAAEARKSKLRLSYQIRQRLTGKIQAGSGMQGCSEMLAFVEDQTDIIAAEMTSMIEVQYRRAGVPFS